MRYSARVRARGAAIFAACVAGCLFPSLDAQDAVASDSSGNDVVIKPDGGDSGCVISEANLQGYWKLDEGSDITAYDCSGNGRNGTFVGNPSWTTGRNDAGAAILVDPAARFPR